MSRAVLDANVFIRGRSNLEFDEFYTVPEVVEELESSKSRLNFDVRDVKVESPSREVLDDVRERSSAVGAATSDTDERLLALAIDLDMVLVTDDMDLQNLAMHLDADFQSYMGEEVEEKLSWVKVCDNCGSQVEGSKCPRCGSTRFRRKLDRYSSG